MSNKVLAGTGARLDLWAKLQGSIAQKRGDGQQERDKK